MWYYVKTLEYPINLKSCDLNMAKLIITQYGGPDGELGAALRYLNQRYTMPTNKSKGLLTDIGTEEMRQAGLDAYYTDHGWGTFPQAAAGFPYNAVSMAVKGDPIADLTEDLAAEQKARATYEWLMNLTDDAEIKKILGFLREREVVHYQRFGEALMDIQDNAKPSKFNCK